MINELRLGPGWLAAFMLASGALSVGCATGATTGDGLFDGGSGAIDGDGLGLPDATHVGPRDTGPVIIVGTDTGTMSHDTGATGGCTAGTTLCAGSCVNTQSNINNCGACGIVCDSGACNTGLCASSTTGTCVTGETLCSGVCTELGTDPSNCGTCGMVCPSGSCANGSCGAACTGGETSCSGVCTDTTSDSSNCGTCGMACQSGETCSSGSCSSGGGGCGHSPCTTGAALSDSCDPYGDGTTEAVCDCLGDTACCTSSWDSQCVSEAEEYCEYLEEEGFGGCQDPSCQ